MGKWSWAYFLIWLISSSSASADNSSEAKRLYNSGTTHFDLAEYEAALNDFKAGYRHKDDAVFLYNIAQCYRLLKGHEDDAIKFYKSYLRRMPKASNRAEVNHKIELLQEQLAMQEKTQTATPLQPPQPPPVARVEAAPRPPVSEPHAAAIEVSPASAASLPLTASRPTPVYKKWWLWTTVSAVVLVGVGVGLGVGLTRPSGTPTFSAVTF